ncbi:aspartyl protease family A01B [Achlya hypogyna]|uniref:Aspartyl protease family A01B n=1 Tax=Achlya hypogyna TaxID=1202772 RepID=A0A1V9YMS6_ACHHY|nr:aspartyl protease family A01B [Achlya hypogyna]
MVKALAVVAAVAAVLPTCSGYLLELHREESPYDLRRDYDSHTRVRRLSNGSFEVVPLNLGHGTHYTWAYVGYPPQRASVVVDTGSHVLAIPCTGCDGCGKHMNAPFNASLSSTLVYPTCAAAKADFQCAACKQDADACHISQSYSQGGSWDAVVVEDTVALGNASGNGRLDTRLAFGCQKKEDGVFATQVADGILGLADSGTNVVRQLFADKKIDQNVFSLCLTKTGGTLALGVPLPRGSDQRHLGALQFARVSTDTGGWYAVTIRDIRIGGKPVDIVGSHVLNGARKVIIDSGSTTSVLPRALRDEFDRAFKNAGLKNYLTGDPGYDKAQLSKMPTIEYVLEGMDGEDVVLTIPPSLYLRKGDTGRFTASIALDVAAGGVIGADLMTNHDFIFDPDMHRVGFVSATCDYGAATQGSANATVDSASSWESAVMAEAGVEILYPSTADEADSSYPVVNTVVGVSIAVLFLSAIVYAVVRKPTPTKSEWAQLAVDDDDEANELMVPSSPRALIETYDSHPDVHDDFFDSNEADANTSDHDPSALDRL